MNPPESLPQIPHGLREAVISGIITMGCESTFRPVLKGAKSGEDVVSIFFNSMVVSRCVIVALVYNPAGW